MKRKLTGLSRQYQAALRCHLRLGARASLQPALRLGRRAAGLGLEPLELARIHQRALATSEFTKNENQRIQRAEIFFMEAITPILKLKETLNWRTQDLASTHRRLQRGIIRRKSAEAALKKSGQQHTRLLKNALQLQEGMRHRTHKILSAQEEQRHTISHQLQDEIVQTLVSINVRLLSLKNTARGDTANMAKEIASTRRLVKESVQSINRFARELTSMSKLKPA